ncbi:MAG: hypothetical protein NWE95_00070 [Candidatus Bathyarchaeota archaeon]|nr:hypothetical protein [Candidatus Bathyarchaeota archaeon]
MNIKEQDVAIFHRLGLTPLEARIFIVSSRIGRQKIERIASLAGIDRSNAYNVIRKLQEIGLTTQILGKPNLYESLPVKEAVSILLKSKEDEFKSLEKEANNFFDSSNLETPTDVESCEFKIITKPKKAMEQRVINLLKEVNQSFDLIISEIVFTHLFINLAAEQLDCVKRGIEYRIITERTAFDKFNKEIYPFTKCVNFQIRFLSNRPQVEVIITDRKTASLHLISNPISKMQLLKTNHRGCVEIFKNYFEKTWNESQEYKF